jgi:protocatechuate 3,4-dioxygenase beta subunit
LPGNEKDGIWKSLNEKDRAAVTVPFTPIPNSKAGEQSAKFDIVMGYTPEV